MEMELNWNRAIRALFRNRGKKQPLGLSNASMSCYINSVLQCLTYTPPLANYCLQRKHLSTCTKSDNKTECAMCLLEDRIVRSLSVANVESEAPESITSNLKIFANYLSPNEETDAQEFLDCVINACEECDKSNVSPNTKILNKLFESVQRTINRCSLCGNSSQSDETVNYFPLPLSLPDGSLTAPEVVINLNETLNRYFTIEYLKGSTACDKCKGISPISIDRSISKPPHVLLLTLQRFWIDMNNFSNTKKISNFVPFPQSLSLTRYLTSPDEGEDCVYTLYAIIVHRGKSMFSGHYVAYVKDADNYWFQCDDKTVTPATKEDVSEVQKNVYMLFYIRQTLPKNNGASGNDIRQTVRKSDGVTCNNIESTLSVNSSDTTMSENPTCNKNSRLSLSPIPTISSASTPAVISMWKKEEVNILEHLVVPTSFRRSRRKFSTRKATP